MGSNCCKGDAAGRPLRSSSSIYSRSRAGASLDDRFTTSDDAGGVRLTVSAARTGDSGIYTLQANNAAGRDRARVRLDVSPDEAPTGEDPPTFLRRLQDLTVKVGTRTRFLVEIVSSTECKVTWYRNERRLMEAERVALARDGNFWCADLAAVSVDDAGRWTCTAENDGGRASCSAHLNVLVPKAYKRPEFVEELRALLTEQGTVSLECKVVGVPTPVLRWFKDSREIKAGDVFALTASAEDPTSLGTYTCEAVNCMGRAYSSSKVHVVPRGEPAAGPSSSSLVPDPPPIFTKELEDLFVKICEPITLNCHVVVPPWPRSVVWYNKEGKVDPSEKYHIVEDGVGGYLLEVSCAEWPDEGEWKCVATSAGGRVGISSCYVTMDVPKNYRKPRFMENLQAVLTEEGLVSFECKVVGFPTPVLSWFKDGQELKPGDVYQLTGTNSLGSYCCIAKNCMGQASSSAELTVEDIQNQLNEEEKLQLFSKNQAPKFIQGLKSVEAKIDEPFRFTIKVAIPPEPSVLWYRDDQPVDESNRCHLGNEERGVFFLDIRSLEFLDQAEWKCVAMNDFGHSVTSCFLKLVIPRHYKKPRFLENLQAILSDEGAVNLECKVIGVPQPILKWYKDGEELKPGDIHRIISGQDGTCCLGTYTCEAQNCMGIAASSASLLGFDDSMKSKSKKKAEEQTLQRNLSLSTIHEERTSQMYDTPVGDVTLDDRGEISFSFDGKEVSVSLYETPDLTEEEALQIVEMYADQLSENVTEHNVVELPPLRFVKETSTSGNLLMEAIIIDVSPEYFISPEEDLRTEADVEDISIADENGVQQLSFEQDIGSDEYLEKSMAISTNGKADIPKKNARKKSDSQRSAEDYFSLSREISISEDKKEDETQALSESELQSFASARSSGKPKSVKHSVEDVLESSEVVQTILSRTESGEYLEKSETNYTSPRDLLSNSEFKTILINICDSLLNVINHLQIIEKDIILKAELMASAATASRSLEIIGSLIKPLSEIHSIADVAKESVSETRNVSALFNNVPQTLKALHQTLTIVEKCIDVESDNKTLVKQTCVTFIEKCGEEMKNCMNDINAITRQDYLILDKKVLSEMNTHIDDISAVIKFAADTIKTRNLLSEASEIKNIEPSLEMKHLQNTQKALFELKIPLRSIISIINASERGNMIESCNVKESDMILCDMSASIQDLQIALEQIESLSVTESNNLVNKYNTELIHTVMDSVVKLRSSFEKLSIEKKENDDKIFLKQSLISIKDNLKEISTHIEATECNVGQYDIIQSDNKLEALQKIAQILISFENNIPHLQGLSQIKENMSIFHKNLTTVLEKVIETNDAKKYFVLIEICDAVKRLSISIQSMDSDIVLPLHSISNTLGIIQNYFVNNVFEPELNCSILTNITDILLNIQETLNKTEEIYSENKSDHIQCLETEQDAKSKANIITDHIDRTIAIINLVSSMESTKELKINIVPTLESICPVLEELKQCIGSIKTVDVSIQENIIELSDSSFVETLASPFLELNQNILILNNILIENLDSLKESPEALSTVAEPLHELHTTLQVIQQGVISQYSENISPYDVSVNIVNAVRNLQSCILMVQEQNGLEAVDELSTLEDISGIKTMAETLYLDNLLLPGTEITQIQESVDPLNHEVVTSSTVQALKILNEHIATIQTQEVLDAVDILSEVSDYSSLKSFVVGLNELHAGVEEILHPIQMENTNERNDVINAAKLMVIAEPMQELHQSLLVLDTSNIPIFENILPIPTEKVDNILENIIEFKNYLSKCIETVFPAMETADDTIEISNKVEKLREKCEQLNDVLESINSTDYKSLKASVDNLLDVTDVSKGIQIHLIKTATEELYEKIFTAHEDMLQFTPCTTDKHANEVSLIQVIEEIEKNIAVLEQFEFIDLSHLSNLTSCKSELAIEIETDSLLQLDDILQKTVNVIENSTQENCTTTTSIANLELLDNFFTACNNKFFIIRHILKLPLNHKKMIRLLQEFTVLKKFTSDFKLEYRQLQLSSNVIDSLDEFFLLTGENLTKVETSIKALLTSQCNTLLNSPAMNIETAISSLKSIIEDNNNKCFGQLFDKFNATASVITPFLENILDVIFNEMANPSTISSDEYLEVTDKMESFSNTVKEMFSSNELDNRQTKIVDRIVSCLQKHNDYKDASGTGKYLIILKCLSECGEILQELTSNATLPSQVPQQLETSENVTLSNVIEDILEPLQALKDQLVLVQEEVLSGVEHESLSIDLNSAESIVNTVTDLHKTIVQQIQTDQVNVNIKDIALIVEANKEIHAIQESLKVMENIPAVCDLQKITNPIAEVEKTIHDVLIIDGVANKIEDKLSKEMVRLILSNINQYIDYIDVFKDSCVTPAIEEINKILDLARYMQNILLNLEIENHNNNEQNYHIQSSQTEIANQLKEAIDSLQVQLEGIIEETTPEDKKKAVNELTVLTKQLKSDLTVFTNLIMSTFKSLEETVPCIAMNNLQNEGNQIILNQATAMVEANESVVLANTTTVISSSDQATESTSIIMLGESNPENGDANLFSKNIAIDPENQLAKKDILKHSIEDFISQNIADSINELSAYIDTNDLKECVKIAKELNECYQTLQESILYETIGETIHLNEDRLNQLIKQLHNSLSVTQISIFENAAELPAALETIVSKLEKITQDLMITLSAHRPEETKEVVFSSALQSEISYEEITMAIQDIEIIDTSLDIGSEEKKLPLVEIEEDQTCKTSVNIRDTADAEQSLYLKGDEAVSSNTNVSSEVDNPKPDLTKVDQKETMESSSFLQNLQQFLSDEVIASIKDISIIKCQALDECTNITKVLLETILLQNHEAREVEFKNKLLYALINLLEVCSNDCEEILSVLSKTQLDKVINTATNLFQDLSNMVFDKITTDEPKEQKEEQSKEESIKRLEILLREVNARVDFTSCSRTTDDVEAIQNNLDEVQTVIIKLKRDFDGMANDTLNETLEDLECSVRSVQLQINEDSPVNLLKESCATLQHLVKNINETNEIHNIEPKTLETSFAAVLSKCSDDTEKTIQLLDIATNKDIVTDTSAVSEIVSDLDNLRIAMKSLNISFTGNPDTIIERGVEILQNLEQLEEKVFSIEKNATLQSNLPVSIRDSIVTAIHAVYGSISNMRGTIMSVQKQYMFENYAKPSESFLSSIKLVSLVYKNTNEDFNKIRLKSLSKSLRNVLNHFEDIKFYINLDKTARLPSDSTFTKIILENFKTDIESALAILNKRDDIECVLIKCIESQLQSIEHKTTLEVKEKIPIFKELSSQLVQFVKSLNMLHNIKIEDDKVSFCVTEDKPQQTIVEGMKFTSSVVTKNSDICEHSTNETTEEEGNLTFITEALSIDSTDNIEHNKVEDQLESELLEENIESKRISLETNLNETTSSYDDINIRENKDVTDQKQREIGESFLVLNENLDIQHVDEISNKSSEECSTAKLINESKLPEQDNQENNEIGVKRKLVNEGTDKHESVEVSSYQEDQGIERFEVNSSTLKDNLSSNQTTNESLTLQESCKYEDNKQSTSELSTIFDANQKFDEKHCEEQENILVEDTKVELENKKTCIEILKDMQSDQSEESNLQMLKYQETISNELKSEWKDQIDEQKTTRESKGIIEQERQDYGQEEQGKLGKYDENKKVSTVEVEDKKEEINEKGTLTDEVKLKHIRHPETSESLPAEEYDLEPMDLQENAQEGQKRQEKNEQQDQYKFTGECTEDKKGSNKLHDTNLKSGVESFDIKNEEKDMQATSESKGKEESQRKINDKVVVIAAKELLIENKQEIENQRNETHRDEVKTNDIHKIDTKEYNDFESERNNKDEVQLSDVENESKIREEQVCQKIKQTGKDTFFDQKDTNKIQQNVNQQVEDEYNQKVLQELDKKDIINEQLVNDEIGCHKDKKKEKDFLIYSKGDDENQARKTQEEKQQNAEIKKLDNENKRSTIEEKEYQEENHKGNKLETVQELECQEDKKPLKTETKELEIKYEKEKEKQDVENVNKETQKTNHQEKEEHREIDKGTLIVQENENWIEEKNELRQELNSSDVAIKTDTKNQESEEKDEDAERKDNKQHQNNLGSQQVEEKRKRDVEKETETEDKFQQPEEPKGKDVLNKLEYEKEKNIDNKEINEVKQEENDLRRQLKEDKEKKFTEIEKNAKADDHEMIEQNQKHKYEEEEKDNIQQEVVEQIQLKDQEKKEKIDRDANSDEDYQNKKQNEVLDNQQKKDAIQKKKEMQKEEEGNAYALTTNKDNEKEEQKVEIKQLAQEENRAQDKEQIGAAAKQKVDVEKAQQQKTEQEKALVTKLESEEKEVNQKVEEENERQDNIKTERLATPEHITVEEEQQKQNRQNKAETNELKRQRKKDKLIENEGKEKKELQEIERKQTSEKPEDKNDENERKVNEEKQKLQEFCDKQEDEEEKKQNHHNQEENKVNERKKKEKEDNEIQKAKNEITVNEQLTCQGIEQIKQDAKIKQKVEEDKRLKKEKRKDAEADKLQMQQKEDSKKDDSDSERKIKGEEERHKKDQKQTHALVDKVEEEEILQKQKQQEETDANELTKKHKDDKENQIARHEKKAKEQENLAQDEKLKEEEEKDHLKKQQEGNKTNERINKQEEQKRKQNAENEKTLKKEKEFQDNDQNQKEILVIQNEKEGKPQIKKQQEAEGINFITNHEEENEHQVQSKKQKEFSAIHEDGEKPDGINESTLKEEDELQDKDRKQKYDIAKQKEEQERKQTQEKKEKTDTTDLKMKQEEEIEKRDSKFEIKATEDDVCQAPEEKVPKEEEKEKLDAENERTMKEEKEHQDVVQKQKEVFGKEMEEEIMQQKKKQQEEAEANVARTKQEIEQEKEAAENEIKANEEQECQTRDQKQKEAVAKHTGEETYQQKRKQQKEAEINELKMEEIEKKERRDAENEKSMTEEKEHQDIIEKQKEVLAKQKEEVITQEQQEENESNEFKIKQGEEKGKHDTENEGIMKEKMERQEIGQQQTEVLAKKVEEEIIEPKMKQQEEAEANEAENKQEIEQGKGAVENERKAKEEKECQTRDQKQKEAVAKNKEKEISQQKRKQQEEVEANELKMKEKEDNEKQHAENERTVKEEKERQDINENQKEALARQKEEVVIQEQQEETEFNKLKKKKIEEIWTPDTGNQGTMKEEKEHQEIGQQQKQVVGKKVEEEIIEQNTKQQEETEANDAKKEYELEKYKQVAENKKRAKEEKCEIQGHKENEALVKHKEEENSQQKRKLQEEAEANELKIKQEVEKEKRDAEIGKTMRDENENEEIVSKQEQVVAEDIDEEIILQKKKQQEDDANEAKTKQVVEQEKEAAEIARIANEEKEHQAREQKQKEAVTKQKKEVIIQEQLEETESNEFKKKQKEENGTHDTENEGTAKEEKDWQEIVEKDSFSKETEEEIKQQKKKHSEEIDAKEAKKKQEVEQGKETVENERKAKEEKERLAQDQKQKEAVAKNKEEEAPQQKRKQQKEAEANKLKTKEEKEKRDAENERTIKDETERKDMIEKQKETLPKQKEEVLIQEQQEEIESNEFKIKQGEEKGKRSDENDRIVTEEKERQETGQKHKEVVAKMVEVEIIEQKTKQDDIHANEAEKKHEVEKEKIAAKNKRRAKEEEDCDIQNQKENEALANNKEVKKSQQKKKQQVQAEENDLKMEGKEEIEKRDAVNERTMKEEEERKDMVEKQKEALAKQKEEEKSQQKTKQQEEAEANELKMKQEVEKAKRDAEKEGSEKELEEIVKKQTETLAKHVDEEIIQQKKKQQEKIDASEAKKKQGVEKETVKNQRKTKEEKELEPQDHKQKEAVAECKEEDKDQQKKKQLKQAEKDELKMKQEVEKQRQDAEIQRTVIEEKEHKENIQEEKSKQNVIQQVDADAIVIQNKQEVEKKKQQKKKTGKEATEKDLELQLRENKEKQSERTTQNENERYSHEEKEPLSKQKEEEERQKEEADANKLGKRQKKEIITKEDVKQIVDNKRKALNAAEGNNKLEDVSKEEKSTLEALSWRHDNLLAKNKNDNAEIICKIQQEPTEAPIVEDFGINVTDEYMNKNKESCTDKTNWKFEESKKHLDRELKKYNNENVAVDSINVSQHYKSKTDTLQYIKEYQYEPSSVLSKDRHENSVFVDHYHHDYTMDFKRPSAYREKTFYTEQLSPEIVRNYSSTGIYKAGQLKFDAQFRSSVPRQIERRSSEITEKRLELRQRSKAVSEARNTFTERRASVPRDFRRKPVFSTYLTDRTAVEGSRVKLTCSVLSSTDPKIIWYKNGTVLDSKMKYKTKYIDGLITLEILNVVTSDSAEYSCTVENENGSVNTSANLKVYPSFEASPIPPTFTRSIRDMYHLAENELVLECRIRGQPLPTITWLKNDKPISYNNRIQAYYLADGVCRLAISQPTSEDSGSYTCKAENSIWSDQISHVVNFTGKESRLSSNLTTIEKSRFNRQVIESRRPHFGNVMTDYNVSRGGTIGLQVEIKGFPTRVEWLREGLSVTDTYTNARAFVEQGLYTLALSDVTERESGLYTCRAWGTHGTVDMNAAITVVHPNEMEGKPAIIIGRPAKDVLISIGEDLNISFRVQGEPKPKVILMKGIRDVTNSQRVCKMTSDDYMKFTVKRSVISDAGTYCVLARNAYGCDRAFVTVVIRQRASSENLISDWTYPVDDTALSITERKYKNVPERIPGEPTVVDGGNNWVSLAWPKPDTRAAAPVISFKVESWLIGKEGGARWVELGITPLNCFDIFNLKQGEEYHFRVTPRNRYGWGESVQTSLPIGVGLAGDRPEFVDNLPGQIKALNGETANFCCSVKGKPTPEIIWMKNGHEVEEDGRKVLSSFNGYECNLTLKDIGIEDEARYSCEASNVHGRASTYVRLAVVTDRLIWEADAKLKRERSADVDGEYPPQFTMRLRDRRVQATYPVRLTCQVVGNPAPFVTWYKDGQEIMLDNRRTKSQDEHFHTLEIAPTTLDDGGVYEAMARNSCGAISCRCSLVVDKGIRAYVAPEFCCGLDPLYRLSEGEELRITAVVEAYPSVGVTWYRDGVRLRPSRRAIMTLDRDGQIELALASVTPRDAGVYSCTASNEVGRATTSGKVQIISDGTTVEKKTSPPVLIRPDVPYSKEPMFIRKPRSSEAREGDTVIIECEVVGDPKPDVYWLRDFLKPDYYRDATHFKRVGEGPEYRFEIPHAKLDYTGAYSVVARNVHGEAKAIISLQILAKDPSAVDEHNIRYGRVEVIPRFERELTDLLCHDGDVVEFECRISGNPEPHIRWFHYTELIRECPDFEWSFENGAARLKIRQVTADDEGTYTCEAVNNLGKATSSACLVVYPPGEPNTLSQRLRRPPALLSATSTPRSTPRTTPARSVSRTPGPEIRRVRSPSRQMVPKFYTYPFNKVAEEGDSVVFQCAVKGLPAPWSTWDKDGVIITPSSRISIKEKDEMLRILEINEVTIEDVGLYRITLENDYGRVEASARLEVITQKGKFYAGVRSYSASPRKAHSYRRRLSSSRQD